MATDFDDDDMMMLDGTEFDDPPAPTSTSGAATGVQEEEESSAVLGALGLMPNAGGVDGGASDSESSPDNSSVDDVGCPDSASANSSDEVEGGEEEETFEQVCGVLKHLCDLLEECQEDVQYCIRATPVNQTLPGESRLGGSGSHGSSLNVVTGASAIAAALNTNNGGNDQATSSLSSSSHQSYHHLISKWLFLCEGSPQDVSSIVGVNRVVHVLAKELGIHRRKLSELIDSHRQALQEEAALAKQLGVVAAAAELPACGTHANLKPYSSFARCSAAPFLRVLAAIAKLEAKEFSALVAVKYNFLDATKHSSSTSSSLAGARSGRGVGQPVAIGAKRKAGSGATNTNASIVATDASCEVDIVGANGLRWYKVRIGKGTVAGLTKGLQRLRSDGAYTVANTGAGDAEGFAQGNSGGSSAAGSPTDSQSSSNGGGGLGSRSRKNRRFLDVLDPGLARMRRFADDPILNGCPFGMSPELILVLGEKPPRDVVKVLHTFDVQILVLELPSPFQVVEDKLRLEHQQRATVDTLLAAAALDAEVEQLQKGSSSITPIALKERQGTSPILTARALSASPTEEWSTSILNGPESHLQKNEQEEEVVGGSTAGVLSGTLVVHEIMMVPKRRSPMMSSGVGAGSSAATSSSTPVGEEGKVVSRSLLGINRLKPTIVNFDVTALVAVCCDMCNGAAGHEFPGHKVLNQQSSSEADGHEAVTPIHAALVQFSRLTTTARRKGGSHEDEEEADVELAFLQDLPLASEFFPSVVSQGLTPTAEVSDVGTKLLGCGMEQIQRLFTKLTSGEENKALTAGATSASARLNWVVVESAWKEFCWILETLAGRKEIVRAAVLSKMLIVMPDALGGPEAMKLVAEAALYSSNNRTTPQNKASGSAAQAEEDLEVQHLKRLPPTLISIAALPKAASDAVAASSAPSTVILLRETQKVQLRHKMIFGVADSFRGLTLTANRQFVHAALDQGVSICVAFHPSRSLTERKRAGEEAPAEVRKKAMEQRKERQRASK